MNDKPEDVLKQIRRSNTTKVKFAVTDLDGVLRGKFLDVDKFLGAAETGIGFCNLVFGWDIADTHYLNVEYTGLHTGYPDAKVNLDLSTYRRVPWDGGIPFFLGDFVDESDRPLPICPRQLLKQILAQAEINGLFPKVGLEFEWVNFRESPTSVYEALCGRKQPPRPLTETMSGYSLLRAGYDRSYSHGIFDSMREYGIPLEAFHTETGPGAYEAAITADDALEAADRGVLFKAGVKEIAQMHGLTASFMARWHTDLPGCSGHIHQSLWNAQGQNVFYDSQDGLRMSKLFRSYVAGQLRCLPDILPMFAPTVNSYKRFVEGHLAPTQVNWGKDNRTVAIRVIPGGERSTRMELRVGGADINPYLAVAAGIAAGLYGIENQLTLEQPMVEGDGYRDSGAAFLARNLMEATERFHASPIARELFGHQFVEHYARTREWEWKAYQKSVTDWELKRYLELI